MMRKKIRPNTSKAQLQLILELSKQEKTITHLRNLLQERDHEIDNLRKVAPALEVHPTNWASAKEESPDERDNTIESLNEEINVLQTRLDEAESQQALNLSPRLRIQVNCEFKAILPELERQTAGWRKNSVVLPPINVGRENCVSDSSSVRSSQSKRCSFGNSSAVGLRSPTDLTGHLEESNADAMHCAGGEVITIDESQNLKVEEDMILKENEMLQAKCEVFDAKLKWWRKEVSSCLDQIAKLKIAMFLEKEKEEREMEWKKLADKEVEEIRFSNDGVELDPSDQDEDVSLIPERREPTDELNIITADSPDNGCKIIIANFSIALRDTRKECKFWENEFLQTMMENAEIRAFFGGPHINEGAPSLRDELHGRIEGLDHAIVILKERNENLAFQINQNDRKLCAALEQNILLQNQLKRTDQCLKDTVLRASAEKSNLVERLGSAGFSQPITNSHIFAPLGRARRKPGSRGYATASSPLSASNSCTTLFPNKTGELSLMSRKKSGYLVNYTEESARRKNVKMREYARGRVREKNFNSDSSCGASPKRKKSQPAASERDRDPGLGSWDNPPDSSAIRASSTRRLSL